MAGIGPELPAVAKKKVLGPQLPPHLQRRVPDDEDHTKVAEVQEYGPAIPVAMKDLSAADLSFYKQKELEKISEKDIVKKQVAVTKREDWMIKPPEAKRAGFTQKTVFSKKGVEEVDSAIWTASPSEREDVLKKRKRDELSQSQTQISKKDLMAKEVVAEHNAKHRATSLLDQHQKKTGGEAKDDDLSHKRFDRERDIVTRQVDKKKRDNMVQEAKTLSSKFSSGKFL